MPQKYSPFCSQRRNRSLDDALKYNDKIAVLPSIDKPQILKNGKRRTKYNLSIEAKKFIKINGLCIKIMEGKKQTLMFLIG